MKVLHVYKDYYPVLGGIENHIRMLAEEQIKRGYRVTVLVTNPSFMTEINTINGVQVIKAGRLATIASTPLSPSLPLRFLQQRPDIVHLHFPYPVGELSYLLFGRSSHMVITYHSDVVRQKSLLFFYRPFLWKVLRKADRIIATSPNYIESSPYLSSLKHKCIVVPLSIDLDHFLHAEPSKMQQIRAVHGSPLILFVGKLRYYKGLNYLLQAMTDIPCNLLIIGEGSMEPELQQLTASLNLSGKVFFLGEVSDEELPAYYHACDIFVLPASERSEAFGTVQLEAMASGLPVVCTELGTGTSFVNIHGKTGLVVPARDAEALAAAILKLLGDGNLRQEMARHGRERAFQEFSLQTMVDRITKVYEEILKSGQGVQ